jgi:hypothetical protein
MAVGMRALSRIFDARGSWQLICHARVGYLERTTIFFPAHVTILMGVCQNFLENFKIYKYL